MKGVNFLRIKPSWMRANVGPSPTCTYIAGTRPYGTDPYCGRPSVVGKSWCSDHFHACFRVIDSRLQRDFLRGVLSTSTRSK